MDNSKYGLAQQELENINVNQLSANQKIEYYSLGAQIYQVNYDYEKALLFLIEAQKIAKDLDHTSYLKVSIELANFYTMQDQPIEAKKIFDLVAPDYNTSTNVACRYYHRKAFLYNQMGVLDTALLMSYRALELAKSYEFIDAQGTIYNELANIYEKKQLVDSALVYYELACSIYENNLRYYANAYFNLARLNLSIGNTVEGIEMLKQNLALIDTTDWATIKSPIQLYLSEAYKTLGDTSSYMHHYILYLEQNLQVLQDNYKKQYQDLNLKYQTEQKNKEIAYQKNVIQNEKNQRLLWIWISVLSVGMFAIILIFYGKIRAKNKELSRLLKDNKFLMKETNHRVKNNLQLVVSLLNRELFKEDASETDISSIQNITNQINSISELHSQLYKHDNLSEIELKQLFTDIINQYELHFKSLKIECVFQSASTISVEISQGINLGLLINELITNSVKYAWVKTSKNYRSIHIKLNETPKEIEIEYLDNGDGSKSEIEPKLISLLLKQLKANYTLSLENGMYLKLTFKKNEGSNC
ncbi:MAG: hypothetical protein H6600_04540 [Flavobacteriales bacterium]|nr:hypothetical protein [Flavobacteriales bacterium]MCB9197703.1 hypothetical protein [Flavobacteriales bacterium]